MIVPSSYLAWLQRETVTKQELRDEFTSVMRANMDGEHFNLLPSEAAAIVAERFGVAPETVLLSFSRIDQ